MPAVLSLVAGQPAKLCASARAAHAFLYVDQGVERETLVETLHDPQRGFRGYAVASQDWLNEDALRPGGWTPHISQEEAKRSTRFRDSFAVPFGLFVVLDRHGVGEEHGPERLAILFIGGDGIASYDALYCQGDGTLPPVVVQDHGFGGNYTSFGDGGLLERIARACRILPEYLLVGDTSEPWKGYADTGTVAEPGGMHAFPRRLFRRDPA